MGSPRSAHRRRFTTTTVLGVVGLVAVVVAAVAAALLDEWGMAHDRTPSWVVWLLAVAVAGLLGLLALYAVLVIVGGLVVLHRDRCEDEGVPYVPARPRERILSPLPAAVRRKMRPGARFLPGEVVEVRSLPEILATLDERGCLEGMPFMPEMEAYCGHRFEVHRRVDKVWEYAHDTGVRRVRRAVLLVGLRCDGQSHGGCQAACQLIWKEAWLRAPGSSAEALATLTPTDATGRAEVELCTETSVDGERRFVCQMTEIIRASAQISHRDPRHYARDLVSGNVRFAPLVTALGIRAFNGANWRLRGTPWPVLTPLDSDVSPHQDLGLQPGQLVRVRSKREIEATLNRKLRNRGLEFGNDQLFCAGGSYRVAARIDRMVDERTGELLHFKTASILLEGAHANGGTVLTPQNEYFFWREIWLDPQPSTDETESP